MELVGENGERFELDHPFLADDTTLVLDSEKLCRLVSEFVRMC